MARTGRLLGPVAARVGDDVIVWLAPGDDTFLRPAHPLRGHAAHRGHAARRNKGHTGYVHRPGHKHRPGPANASPEPRRSHPEAQTTPKLVHPRPRGLHPQSEPPCFHPEARTTPKLAHPRSRGLPPRSEPPCSHPLNLTAPTPGAHIPSHNTSTPTQKETLCSQLSTSA